MFAKPLEVIPNNGFKSIAEHLNKRVAEHSVILVLVGIPYAIEGGDTPKTTQTKAFLEQLASAISVTVQGWDERYTTSEAVEELIKLGYNWKQRREIQDAMAAAMILKSYLESQC